MRGGEDWSLLAQNWALSSLASAFAAGVAGTSILGVVVGLFSLNGLLNQPMDWIVLPIYLIGGLLLIVCIGAMLALYGMIVCFPLAAVVIAILSFAESRSPKFRHWFFWCLAGLLSAPVAMAGLTFLLNWNLEDYFFRPGWLATAAVCVFGSLAGALVGRQWWHVFHDSGMTLDEPMIEATSEP